MPVGWLLASPANFASTSDYRISARHYRPVPRMDGPFGRWHRIGRVKMTPVLPAGNCASRSRNHQNTTRLRFWRSGDLHDGIYAYSASCRGPRFPRSEKFSCILRLNTSGEAQRRVPVESVGGGDPRQPWSHTTYYRIGQTKPPPASCTGWLRSIRKRRGPDLLQP